jgi:hypothetical protein
MDQNISMSFFAEILQLLVNLQCEFLILQCKYINKVLMREKSKRIMRIQKFPMDYDQWKYSFF